MLRSSNVNAGHAWIVGIFEDGKELGKACSLLYHSARCFVLFSY